MVVTVNGLTFDDVMPLNVPVMRMYHNYTFARAFEDFNTRAKLNGEPVIPVSRGREMYQDYINNLATRTAYMYKNPDGTPMQRQAPDGSMQNVVVGGDLNNATMATSAMALSYTFQKATGKTLVKGVSENDAGYLVIDNNQFKDSFQRVIMNRYYKEFNDITGWSDPANREARQKGTMHKGYMPISPFDPDYQENDAVLKNGSEILYAPLDKFCSMKQDGNNFVPEFASKEQQMDIPLVRRRVASNGEYVFRDVGQMQPKQDAGIGRLRQFMSDSEYMDCCRNMYQNADNRVSPEIVDKAIAILSMLQDQGYTYKVKPDTHKGQLKAVIDGTKMSIRLTDLNKNARYVGRVYNDGYSYYFQSSGQIGAARGKISDEDLFKPSVEDSVNIIRYVLGERVERYSNHEKYNIGSSTRALGTPQPNLNSKFQTAYTRTKAARNGKPATEVFQNFYCYPGKTDIPGTNQPERVHIQMENDHSMTHQSFSSKDEAASFLQDAISSARKNFSELVNLDYLIEEAKEHADDPDYVPAFSSDTKISPMQRIYWEVLTTDKQLFMPTEQNSSKEVNMLLGDMYENDDDEDDFDDDEFITGEVYSGTPEENVRAHLEDSLDTMFGTFELNEDGKSFNPSVISAFMDSNTGSVYRNNDDIVAAMYKLEFTGDEVLGEDFQTNLMKDRLIRFDAESGQKMGEIDSPFMQTMYRTIRDTINTSGCQVNPDDILIDKNGVVSYTAIQHHQTQVTRNGKRVFENSQREIHGSIGQIFEPDNDGVVETHYNGSHNKIFTPGYNAYILPERSDLGTLGQNVIERTRGESLEQVMKKRIAHTLRTDLIGSGDMMLDENGTAYGKEVGTTTSINNTYRGLYSTRYKVSIEPEPGETLKDTYLRQCDMTHLDRDVVIAQMRTNRGVLHYDKAVADNSTVDAETRRGNKELTVHEMANDNFKDMYMLTGRTNMAITQNHCEGYTDPVLTGSGKNQGLIRYLVEGAYFDPDGKIVPSEDKNARAPLMNTPAMRYVDNIPADRVQMVGSNYLSASGTAGLDKHERVFDGKEVTGVGMAMLTLQGLTFDDGAVISSDFAEKYGVVNEEGEIRPLQTGDKICDFAGNKSIVAKVIDRNMSLEEAEEQGLTKAVELFKVNPDLDVVQAPYSAVSRFNAASAKLLMEDPVDLKLPDGTVAEGSLGFAPVIITDKTVDEKTKQYDEDEVKAGKGRKISAQLGWAFSAKGAAALLDECFSTNNAAVSNFREVMISMGLDIDEMGTLRVNYAPHNGEERSVFTLPSDDAIRDSDTKDLRNLFRDSVDSRGGFLEMPFPLMMPSGQQTPPLSGDSASRNDRVMYQLPVLSAHMRSGQTFEDGISMAHDYTNQYVKIFSNAVDYLKQEQIANNPESSDSQKTKATQAMEAAKNRAQSAYLDITDNLKNRKLETKHNMMRDDFMSHRMPNSATAVWTPDTRLNLDQVAMSGKMMQTLGIKEGDDWTMIWRDPILRDYGTRFMQVVRDDSLTGIAVNPLVAIVFDGDFDGDSVGAWKPSRINSKEEAMEKFSFAMNMLDKTKVRENGDYALMINDSMDVISAEVADEKRKEEAVARGEDYGMTLKERRMDLEHRANEIDKLDIPMQDKFKMNQELLNELSDWSRDCLGDTCATEVVSFKDPQSHMQSLVDMVDHGAKGSHKKLKNYAKYAGYTFDESPEGKILPRTVEASDTTFATTEDVEDVELATAIKSHGTGIAGAVSQRLVMAARNLGGKDSLSSILQMTYLSTQGLLQAKHDPDQAKKLYNGISGPVREIWRGHVMEHSYDTSGNDTWKPKIQQRSDGTYGPVQATKEEWVKQFMEIHEIGLELEGCINPEMLHVVADTLYDEKTGRMRDIEDDSVIHDVAAPMDVLAYKPNKAFETLCDMAKEGRNIFEGDINKHFAPASVRRNMEAMEKGDIEALRPISTTDVRSTYDPIKKEKGHIDIQTITPDQVYNAEAAVTSESVSSGRREVLNVLDSDSHEQSDDFDFA